MSKRLLRKGFFMEKLLCPSMMCADFSNLGKEVVNLEAADIDIFHVDIMDGNYVPNFGMGLQDLESIRKSTTKPVDVHLMIMNPSRYVERFIDLGANIIYIHPEVDLNPVTTLETIRNLGAKPGIAISPGVSLESISELFPYCEYVMIMTVNPGFAGQKFLESMNDKIEKLIEIQKNFEFEILVDGAISKEKIDSLSDKGVNGFVLGTSALFGKNENYKEIIESIR